jgi:predicted enzyme related to lactoylglutathione lyase
MTTYDQGSPCWYELATSDLEGAQRFYSTVLGWHVAGAGMAGFDYRLAETGGDKVAGMMSNAGLPGNPPPNWLVYFAVEDADDAVEAIASAGGRVLKSPEDIPGTGRYAVAADPQGAVFGLLQPEPMDGSPQGRAFDQAEVGHGSWHELMSTDPTAGFEFYAERFSWTKSQAIDMGGMGTYQVFAHGGQDIGGVMGLGNAPVPCWLPYFGVGEVKGAMDRIRAGGGIVVHGPQEVPGGAVIAIARDPQGAHFAVVGPKAERTGP